jgi:hypothetical protein
MELQLDFCAGAFEPDAGWRRLAGPWRVCTSSAFEELAHTPSSSQYDPALGSGRGLCFEADPRTSANSTIAQGENHKREKSVRLAIFLRRAFLFVDTLPTNPGVRYDFGCAPLKICGGARKGKRTKIWNFMA